MATMNNAGGTPAVATVLLVEDDPKIASFIRKGLRHEGCREEWVSSGEEAILRLQEGGVDVLVLDLGLPEIDGLDVLRHVRSRGVDIPVIVVTGRTDPRDRTAALSLGVNAYLTKPFAWSELRAALLVAVEEMASSRQEGARTMPDQG
jgi:DNA-binding response OmpR family regulator